MAAWVVAQVVGFFVEQGYVGRTLLDVTLFLIVVGFFAMLVVAWYHGREGRQAVTRAEGILLGVLLLVAAGGTVAIASGTRAAEVAPEDVFVDLGDRSIAVLPFENDLSDPSMSWLDRGVAELLATDLSQVSSIRVVGGQRVIDLMRQLGEEDRRTVPEDLRTRVTKLAGARYMLTGRLVGTADQVVLIASLTDVDTGEITVGAREQGADVFALVDAVSRNLVENALALREGERLASVSELTTGNLEAYAEYQRGREARYLVQFRDAARHFRRAVALDSTFALAHFQLAGVQVQLGDFGGSSESLRRARQNLTHATTRDSMFIAGLGAMIGGDPASGERVLRDLVAQFPDDKEARIVLAGMLRAQNPASGEGARLIEETLRLDPLYAVGYNELAYTESARGNYDSALALIDTYVSLEPDQPNPLDSRGEIAEAAGRAEEARESYREALTVDPDFTMALRHLARSYLREDRPADAIAALEPYTAEELPQTRIAALSLSGDAAFWAGDFEAAVASFERAADAAAEAGAPEQVVNVLRTLVLSLVHLGRFAEARPYAERLSAATELDGTPEMLETIAAGEAGRPGDLDRAAESFVSRFRDTPALEQFAGFAAVMADAWRAFYGEDYGRVLELALRSPFQQGDTGTEFPGFPVMRSLLALGQGDRAVDHVRVARQAGMTGIPGQWDSVTERLLQYYEGRGHEIAGDTAAAIASYETLLAGWGAAADTVTPVADTRARLNALRAGG